MASVSRFLTNKLRLKVNEAKSAVGDRKSESFSGSASPMTGASGASRQRLSTDSKGGSGTLTRRTRGFSLQQLVKELKPYIVGWRGYFGLCQTPRVLTNLEAWIRRRLRLYLWRQWRTRQNRFAELRRRGVAKFPAAVAAGSPTGLWRMSGHPAVQQALRNNYFEPLGLPQIYAPAQA
jgi:RNA-directed DNA polymerase